MVAFCGVPLHHICHGGETGNSGVGEWGDGGERVSSKAALTAADVEPVLIVRGELPGDGRLHEINKLGKGDLALLLEVDSITLHELVSVDILDGDAGLLKTRLLSETRHFL